MGTLAELDGAGPVGAIERIRASGAEAERFEPGARTRRRFVKAAVCSDQRLGAAQMAVFAIGVAEAALGWRAVVVRRLGGVLMLVLVMTDVLR